MKAASSPIAWYALRRTLPPWRFEENLQELVSYCQKWKINEVILKCDTEEFSHGYPTVEWLKAYQIQLLKAREALQSIGVVYSLNPWVTHGHADRGRDMRSRFPEMQMMVGHDGVTTQAQACSQCPSWRAMTRELWTLYAETNPHAIWIEDDIRLFNHSPVQWGCFCPLHLEKFSKRIGKTVKREELVQIILGSGAPHPWRAEWLNFLGESMVDTAGFFEKTVHSISSKTHLGLMSSCPENHTMEGRNWALFSGALAGPTTLVSRPAFFNYNEASLRGLYSCASSLKQTRYCLPRETIEQTEVDNGPFSQFSKSTTFMGLQMAISFALGAEGVTLNLYDHLGTPMLEDPCFGEFIGAKKTYFNGMAIRCQGRAPLLGVQILHRDRFANHLELPKNSHFKNLISDAHAWSEVLESLGFPTTYEESPVVALSGQIVRSLTLQEIQKILQKGVLLDATAARILCEKGFAKDIGADMEPVKSKNDYSTPIAAEEFFNAEFGGAKGRYMTMAIPDCTDLARVARPNPVPEAKVLSRLVDMDGKEIFPFLTLYENGQGGRVAIFPLGIYPSQFLAMLNPLRKTQFSKLLHWLSKETLPMEIIPHQGAYPLGFYRPAEGHAILGAFNLSLDSWKGVTFDIHSFGKDIRTIETLDSEGNWVKLTDFDHVTSLGRTQITVRQAVNLQQPLVLDVFWA